MPYVEKKDRRRPTKIKGMYQNIYQDSRWKNLRNKKIKQNPLCEECLKKGITEPSVEVHHKIKFSDGEDEKQMKTLAFNPLNVECLCIKHHKERHINYKIDYTLRMKLLNY